MVVLWTYTMNNRKGDQRAEQVRDELIRVIGDLATRVTEVKTDLGVRITELKADMNGQISGLSGQMNSLKADLTNQTSQLRSDIVAVKSDVKELVQSEIGKNFAEIKIEILKTHHELMERFPPEGKRASSGTS